MSENVKHSWDDAGLEVLQTTDFEGTRIRRGGVYVVCFGAAWCRPTRGFVPKFAARKGHLPARLAIADITELSDPLWDLFQIKITPTIRVFRDGTTVGRVNGRRLIGLRDSDLDRLGELVGTLGGPESSPPASPS